MDVSTEKILQELANAVPGGLIVEENSLENYRHDEAVTVEGGRPLAALQPTSTSQVQEIMKIASRHKISVVPRGGGSGLSGDANAIDGCLVVSVDKMNRQSD